MLSLLDMIALYGGNKEGVPGIEVILKGKVAWGGSTQVHSFWDQQGIRCSSRVQNPLRYSSFQFVRGNIA